MRISLGVKDKLGLIDGTLKKLDKGTSDFAKWRKTYYKVRSWILGSLTKELVESFVYCSTARILWEELKDRFGESNGPRVYKIQREITSIQQGNDSLANYFNKLKRLWEDLNKLIPVPHCSCEDCKCDVSKKLEEIDFGTKTIHFLMGLNEAFDTVRNRILMQEPLPSANSLCYAS